MSETSTKTRLTELLKALGLTAAIVNVVIAVALLSFGKTLFDGIVSKGVDTSAELKVAQRKLDEVKPLLDRLNGIEIEKIDKLVALAEKYPDEMSKWLKTGVHRIHMQALQVPATTVRRSGSSEGWADEDGSDVYVQRCALPPGMFDAPPSVFLAINSLNPTDNDNRGLAILVSVDVKSATKDAFTLKCTLAGPKEKRPAISSIKLVAIATDQVPFP